MVFFNQKSFYLFIILNVIKVPKLYRKNGNLTYWDRYNYDVVSFFGVFFFFNNLRKITKLTSQIKNPCF